MELTLLNKIEMWLGELEAIANKNKLLAQIEGGKYIWYSSQKNKDIKRKLTFECEKLSNSEIRLSSRSSSGGSGGEWLYDYTLREFDKNGHFLGVRLAVEIELSDSNPRGLVYDFNKLLQSDSPYRVFVFQQKSEDECVKLLKCLEGSLEAYKHKLDSVFLISCWLTSKYKFVSKQYKIKDGSLVSSVL
jgi:hypothetical protein